MEVRDFVPGRPRRRVAHSDEDTHGRGAGAGGVPRGRVGVRPHEVGKSVWFELDADAA
ncbi:hypothetical protein GCM10020295_16980 [Streptomyces cinereospinus]